MLTAQEFRQKTLADLQPTAGEIPLDSPEMAERLQAVFETYHQRKCLAYSAGLSDQATLLEIECAMAQVEAAGFRPISRDRAACLAAGVDSPKAVSWRGNYGAEALRGYSITTDFGDNLPPDTFSFRVEYPVITQTTSWWGRPRQRQTKAAVEVWRADISQFATLLPESVVMLLVELRKLRLFSGIAVYAPPKYFKAASPLMPSSPDPVVVGVVGSASSVNIARNFERDIIREFFLASWM